MSYTTRPNTPGTRDPHTGGAPTGGPGDGRDDTDPEDGLSEIERYRAGLPGPWTDKLLFHQRTNDDCDARTAASSDEQWVRDRYGENADCSYNTAALHWTAVGGNGLGRSRQSEADAWSILRRLLERPPHTTPPPKKLTTHDLIQLGLCIAQQLYALEDHDEEPSPELVASMFSHIDAVETKLEGIHHVRRRFLAEEALLKIEETRLAKRRTRARKQREHLEGYALQLLQAHEGMSGERSIDTGTLTARLQKSPPRLVIDEHFDEMAAPPGCVTTIPYKDGIRRALRAGETVPGAHLEQNDHVRWS